MQLSWKIRSLFLYFYFKGRDLISRVSIKNTDGQITLTPSPTHIVCYFFLEIFVLKIFPVYFLFREFEFNISLTCNNLSNVQITVWFFLTLSLTFLKFLLFLSHLIVFGTISISVLRSFFLILKGIMGPCCTTASALTFVLFSRSQKKLF